ncbi:MAG: DUF3857 and transglutaminase domain-containing protein [Hyphomonadaceae bacterium]|nr:DUF3857 and transglutaminase domain-containing protein [Hyphomonadaceae bacterium]
MADNSSSETPVPPQDAWARFVQGPAPAWIKHIEAPHDAEAESAVSWLLRDEQYRLSDKSERYFHFVQRADNEVGVDWLSEIRITFNPSYETLFLHGVTIIREGRAIDALGDADLDFMRTERDMHARIYRGDYSLVIQVRGLEPLDSLDYSYTIAGQNPVFGGRVVAPIGFTFKTPLGRHHARVLHAADLKLEIHAKGPKVKPNRTEKDGVVELVFDRFKAPRHEFEAFVPPEYDDQASVWTFNGFGSWAEVARWAADLYATDPEDATIGELTASCKGQPNPTLAAIAYVQDRIRYVATNFGEGGYRPRAPALIVQRRYGDCKDKALLLAAILRKLGHDAHVALVCAQRPRGPLTDAPAPNAFDHVIVKAKIDGEARWIDATVTGQAGPLTRRWRPHAMATLVARADTRNLELIPPLPDALIGDRSETLHDMSAGVDKPVLFHYCSTATGGEAEGLRRWIASIGAAGIERELRRLSCEEHGEVEQAEPLEISDDTDSNKITLKNRLKLVNPWGATPEGGREYRALICHATALLPTAQAHGRTRPLALKAHPLHHVHVETIKLPRGVRPIGAKNQKIGRKNEAFEFSRQDVLSGAKLKIRVETKTLATHLSATAVLGAQRDETALQAGHQLHLVFPQRGLLRVFA